MKFTRLTPMLQTENLQCTIDWYAKVLGFTCTSRQRDEWCRLERDDVELMFMVNAHLGAPHATATQYFRVDDVLGLWKFVAAHAKTEWGPERMPYGMVEFAIKDCNGYLLSFGQPDDEVGALRGSKTTKL